METKITVLIFMSLSVIVLLLLLVKFLNLIMTLESNTESNESFVLKKSENCLYNKYLDYFLYYRRVDFVIDEIKSEFL